MALRSVHTAPRLAYYRTMPEDDIEKFIAEQKALEAHRQGLIKELLRQKEAAIKAFDDKLEKLGYDGEHASKRSHHKDDAEKKPE